MENLKWKMKNALILLDFYLHVLSYFRMLRSLSPQLTMSG
jgi:hypothetical protein